MLRNSTFVWGSSDVGLTKKNISLPDRVDALQGFGVRSLQLGSGHCVAVTGSEHAFACGQNESGQLGHGDRSRRTTPERLRALCHVRVLRVACGGNHTLLLCDAGVYAVGSNSHGQLGLGGASDALRSTSTPQLIAALGSIGSNIADVACGASISAAITARGELLTWGCAAYGLLGNDNAPGGSNTEDARMPTTVAALAREVTKQIVFGATHALTLWY